jgi:hypothetical protein
MAERRALRANLTANMSTLGEQGSFFGMSEASMDKSTSEAAADVAQSPKPMAMVSQVSASRQLGLAPTVLDLEPSLAEPPASSESIPNKQSQHSKSLPPLGPAEGWEHDSKREYQGLRTDTGPSEHGDSANKPSKQIANVKSPAAGKLVSTMSTPVNMIENMIKRLEPEKPISEKDAGYPIRRRKAAPKPLSVSDELYFEAVVLTFDCRRLLPNLVAFHPTKPPSPTTTCSAIMPVLWSLSNQTRRLKNLSE